MPTLPLTTAEEGIIISVHKLSPVLSVVIDRDGSAALSHGPEQVHLLSGTGPAGRTVVI